MHVVRWTTRRRSGPAPKRGSCVPRRSTTSCSGLVDQIEADPSLFDPPLYLATVEEGDQVLGCAWRNPPFMLGLTRIPAGGAAAVARDAAGTYEGLPGVLGPVGPATEFVERWAERRGVRPRPGQRQRIHAAERVSDLTRRPAGAMRLATVADLAVVGRWVDAFAREAEMIGPPARLAVSSVERGSFWIWEDGGRPVSLAASRRCSTRISPTPPRTRSTTGSGIGPWSMSWTSC